MLNNRMPLQQQTRTPDLLRLTTAGSVDDGKSTLIGRLLYEAQQVPDDQLAAVDQTSTRMGAEYRNLALLTDGLRDERDQGITIDVAYRYFATRRRKFIIVDTPGHVQYTRNMVTGASTADLAIILVDARKGVVEQTRRHAVIASLLRVPHILLCINKMDLVDYSAERFEELEAEFSDFAAKLDIGDMVVIPISALHGENVTKRSVQMPWFEGPSLLYHLEHVYIASDRDLIDVRFPVQWIVRPHTTAHHDYRGYAGQVAGGILKAGDVITALPSGLSTRIAAIDTYDGQLAEARPPMSITLLLEEDLDISRGDIICRPNNQPHVGQDIDAMLCWLHEKPLQLNGRYVIKHTTREARALVKTIRYRMDINSLHRDEQAATLALNDVGRVTLRTTAPLFYDEYRRNRTTGSFILIDQASNDTVAGGMIL